MKGTRSLRLQSVGASIVLGLALTSCFHSMGRWTYPSGRYPTRESSRPASAFVLVEPFLDVRGEKNMSGMYWAYVPLVPVGFSNFDRPESTVHDSLTTNYDADPQNDLARAVVIELLREKIVERAEYASDFRLPSGATHVLRGKIRSFYVAETVWSYGLSVYCVILWGLGCPQGISGNEFCVDLELTEVASGRVVWTASVFDADRYVEGLYYGPARYRFAQLWERRLREKLPGLAIALGAEPPALPDMRDDPDEPARPPKMPKRLGVDARSE